MKGTKKSRNRKVVTRSFNRSCSKSNTSLSQLLVIASYKKRINHLSKNNRLLAVALQESRLEAALQNDLLKDYAKGSNQILFARLKLNEMVKSMAKFVTDLEEVRSHLNIELPSGSNPFTKTGLNDRIIKVPAVNCIEEVSISSESETPSSDSKEKQIPVTSDIEMKSVEEVSLKPSEKLPEVLTSPDTFTSECTEVAPLLFVEDTADKGKKSSSKSIRSKKSRDTEQLSLTPELDIGLTTIRRKRTSSRRMSQCSFPEPRSTRSREKAPSSEKKLSNSETATPGMPKFSPQEQNLKKTEKNHEKSNKSPYLEEVRLLESKSTAETMQHCLINEDHVKPSTSIAGTVNQAEKNNSTSPPYILPTDDNTVVLSVDMELTEVIPPVHSIIVQNSSPVMKPAITLPTITLPTDNNANLKGDTQTLTSIIQNNAPVFIKPHFNSEIDNNSIANTVNEELYTDLKSPKVHDHCQSVSAVSHDMSQSNRNDFSPQKALVGLDKGLCDGTSQNVPLAELGETKEINKNTKNSNITPDHAEKLLTKEGLCSTDESDDSTFTIKINNKNKGTSNISDKKSNGKTSFSVKKTSIVKEVVSSKFEDNQHDSKIAKAGSLVNDSKDTGKDDKENVLTPNLRSSRSKKSINYAFFFSPGDSDDDPSFTIKSSHKKKTVDTSNKKSSENDNFLNLASPTIHKSFAEFSEKVSKDYSVYNLEVSNSEMEASKKKAALRKLKISKQKKNNITTKPLSQKCGVTKVKAGNYKFSKVKSPKMPKNELGVVLKQSLKFNSLNSPSGILKKRQSDFIHASVEKERMSIVNEDMAVDHTLKALPSKDIDLVNQSILDTPKSETKRVSFAPTDVICNFKRMSVSKQIAESRKVRYTSKFALNFGESPSDLTPEKVKLNADADISFGSASDTELYALPLPTKVIEFQNTKTDNVTVTTVPDQSKDAVTVENIQKSASNLSLANCKKIGKLSLKWNKTVQKEVASNKCDKIGDINILEPESPKSVIKDIQRKSLFEKPLLDDKSNAVCQTLESPANLSVPSISRKNISSVHQSLKIPTNPSLLDGSKKYTSSIKSPTNPSLDDLKEKMHAVQTFEASSNPPKSPVKTDHKLAESPSNPSLRHLKEKMSSVYNNPASPSNPPQSPVKTKPNQTKSSEKKGSKKSSVENLKNKTNSKNSLKKNSSSVKLKSVQKQKLKESPIKSLGNSPVLKDVVNIPDDAILPRRRSKQVSYKEPSLNKKLRRE